MGRDMQKRAIVLVAVAGASGSFGACAGRTTAVTGPASPVSPASPDAALSAPASTPPSPLLSASALPVPPPPTQKSAVASSKTVESWAACHQGYKATAKDVSRDVAAMARACEKATKMILLGRTLTGKQAYDDAPQSFPLDALANHCYRVYAQAGEGIKDLDVVIKDSAGVVVGEDATDHPSPVVLENGAVCFAKDDRASVVVSVGMGSGVYAVQVWTDVPPR